MTNWQDNLTNTQLLYTAKALGPTVNSIFQDLLDDKIINLSNLVPENVNPVHLAVVLRATYTRQSEVQGWHEALDVARRACTLMGIDPTDALAGL